MAFKQTKFADFAGFLESETKNPDIEKRIIAENFLLEERLTEQREDSYETHQPSPSDLKSWKNKHENYLESKIHIRPGTPETFTPVNHVNLFPSLEETQYLVRLENADRVKRFFGGTLDEMMKVFKEYLKNPQDVGKRNIVKDIIYKWNRDRDLRPLFAGFWGEVKDIFEDAAGNRINDKNWANRLRDRFGLGHMTPIEGAPIPVLLFHYPVMDIPQPDPNNTKKFAVPTVLDGRLSPFFCPTPKKGWTEGQALDLSEGDDGDYSINSEILHYHIEYKPEHLLMAGWITQPPGRVLEKARKIHMELLSDDFETNVQTEDMN
ncbi:MAG: hypothetical protein QG657_1939 [Acidobacteriota bacterium]|nr:hypothetical protein [Acidobacteriota bacterium]